MARASAASPASPSRAPPAVTFNVLHLGHSKTIMETYILPESKGIAAAFDHQLHVGLQFCLENSTVNDCFCPRYNDQQFFFAWTFRSVQFVGSVLSGNGKHVVNPCSYCWQVVIWTCRPFSF